MAPIVHQDLRKIRVDPAFTGEDNQEVQLDDVQDDSDVEGLSDDEEDDDIVESGNEMLLSDNANEEKTEVNVHQSTEKSAGQRMDPNDAEKEKGEIIIDDDEEEDEDDDVGRGFDNDQNQDVWIAIPFNNVNKSDDRTVDNEVEMFYAKDDAGYEGVEDLSDSEDKEEAVDISDSEEEVIDLDSDSDEVVALNEEDSSRNIEKPLRLGQRNDGNSSDNAIVDSDSDSENISSTAKSKSKQSVKTKNTLKKPVSIVKLPSKQKQTEHSKEAKKKSVVQTPSGKFSVTANKYTTTKQKTGK